MSSVVDPSTQLTDVYIFEQKLKETLISIQRTKKRYQAILFIACVCNGVACSYLIWDYITGNEITVWVYLPAILGTSWLIMFFASGMYTEKITNATKYLTRCNSVLRTFNISYNIDTGKLVILKRTKKKS